MKKLPSGFSESPGNIWETLGPSGSLWEPSGDSRASESLGEPLKLAKTCGDLPGSFWGPLMAFPLVVFGNLWVAWFLETLGAIGGFQGPLGTWGNLPVKAFGPSSGNHWKPYPASHGERLRSSGGLPSRASGYLARGAFLWEPLLSTGSIWERSVGRLCEPSFENFWALWELVAIFLWEPLGASADFLLGSHGSLLLAPSGS